MKTEAQTILDLKSTYTIPCLYHFYQDPPVLVRGDMQYVFDSEGKKYVDCYAGVTVMNCGHANPAIIEPAIDQIRTLQHTTSIYLTRPMVDLARKLVEFLDCDLKRAFFVNSGSEANEGALLLAKLYTGKSGFISLRGGLHGRTSLTMGLTQIPMWRTDPAPPPSLRQAPRPHCPTCDLDLNFPGCGYACVDTVADLLAKNGDIAAVIAEPIQGNGGVIVPPDGYFERLREVVHSAGALLIFDEVQTGFCRTGRRFSFNHLDHVQPDILTVAKALGNGFPIGAFVAREDIAACYTRPGASTTGGNAVSATAAIQVLNYMETEGLDVRARDLGDFLKNGLLDLHGRFPRMIAEVRGRGLMAGMEIRLADGSEAQVTDRVLEDMKNRGYLIGKTGLDRNVLTFMPPLVVEKEDLEGMLVALDATLADMSRKPGNA
ncbi:MAG: aspartate aminotransferase family protein [Lentisphaeria bacterium]|nr:aspartate aminotransferase family protein [Lentisphaeria bacterium]